MARKAPKGTTRKCIGLHELPVNFETWGYEYRSWRGGGDDEDSSYLHDARPIRVNLFARR